MTGGAARKRRALLVPETIQTSAMDCGPAALKSLCSGFGVNVSYGRLREACQTGLDGTSINTIERVANHLGLEATQSMLPVDHLFLERNAVFPALLVTRLPDGPTHFVVAWRRIGKRIQIMDPAKGRRFVNRDQLERQLYRHETTVAAGDWRDWAGSEEFLAPLRERLGNLGIEAAFIDKLLDTALVDPGWFRLAALDAAIRQASLLADVATPGKDRIRKILLGLYHQTCTHPDDIFTIIPAECWSVVPDMDASTPGQVMLLMRGAVLVGIAGTHEAKADMPDPQEAPAELKVALAEKPPSAFRYLARAMTADGLVPPLLLAAAVLLAAVLAMAEALLLRSLFDIGTSLNLPSQRLVAVVAFVAFMVLSAALQFPIIRQGLQRGRQLDLTMRMAILDKLPRLSDRYFQSRPISDMAERGHAIQGLRMLPSMVVHLFQLVAELALLVVGILVIDPNVALPVLGLAAAAIGVPLIAQPLASEADLSVRSHSGALATFYLDALAGAVPIRVHRAGGRVRAQHAALLVEWSRASLAMLKTALTIQAVQSGLITGLVLCLIGLHFSGNGHAAAADLLLLYWALKLPGIGQMVASLILAYPAQRNVLLRLMEPLATPDDGARQLPDVRPGQRRPVSIRLDGGTVLASGHTLLADISLSIPAGEHIAIVGPSGAGKSTLIGLLLGWHQLSGGTIEVDGRTLDADRIKTLRAETAWVDPSVMIWNRSLFDNLLFSAGIDGARRIAQTLSDADLLALVERLPVGMQTALGEAGGLLSGGEAQRLRLGRALVQDRPSLVLMDEPFRGLDRNQRHRLMQHCRSHWAATTLLCVTHDMAETRQFDKVLVIDGGRLIEAGTPSDLLGRNGRYRELMDAEERMRQAGWAGQAWRHIKLENGHVLDVA